jgi:hypothetical protein
MDSAQRKTILTPKGLMMQIKPILIRVARGAVPIALLVGG